MKRLITACCSVLLSLHALHAQQAVLLGPDLEPRLITLRSLSGQGITFTDHAGEAQSLPISEVVRLTFAVPSNMWMAEGYKVVTLRDGQRFVGALNGAGDSGESLRFLVPQLGEDREAEVPLDDLLAVAMKRNIVPPAAGEDDVLLLATGETLIGFVEAVNDQSVSFTIGDAEDPIPIPLDRLHAISVANKPVEVERRSGLFRVGIGGGGSFLIADAEKQAPETRFGTPLTGRVLLPIDDPRVSFSSGIVEQIEPLSGEHALMPLAGVPMKRLSGGEVFGVAMPPRVEPDGSIHLHAPTTVGFELPQGASRLTLAVELAIDDDVPAARHALAGCELVVYDGEEAIGGCTLAPDRAPQRLNLPVNSRGLRIELKPGVNGPVLDRVRISAAEVLVSESADPR